MHLETPAADGRYAAAVTKLLVRHATQGDSGAPVGSRGNATYPHVKVLDKI
jgi:hypothetical protein